MLHMTDIVTILRRRIDQCRCLSAVPATRCCGGCEHDTRCLCEIVEVRRERDEASIDLEVLMEELRERRTDAAEANERISQLVGVAEQLRAERDAARREVCLWVNTDASGCMKSGSEETAIERGWDCFNETP